MAASLISQKIKFSEDEEVKIKKKKKAEDGEEEEVKYDIDLPVDEFHFDVETEDTSIAKTYETKNEAKFILKVPKSEYKNQSFQNAIDWSNLPVQDEFYYRDLALNIKEADNEKTLLFSDARIEMKVKHNTKADYVTAEILAKQKEDRYRGVVFGLDINSTYKRAKKKILNPKTLNVVVPTVAVASAVVNTGIKNAVEVTGEDGQNVDEGNRDFTAINPQTIEYAKGGWTLIFMSNDKQISEGTANKVGENYILCTEGLSIYTKYNYDVKKYYINQGYFPENINPDPTKEKTLILNRTTGTLSVTIKLSEEAKLFFSDDVKYNYPKYPDTIKYECYCRLVGYETIFYMNTDKFKNVLYRLGYSSVELSGNIYSLTIEHHSRPNGGTGQSDSNELIIPTEVPLAPLKKFTEDLNKQRGCTFSADINSTNCTITANLFVIPKYSDTAYNAYTSFSPAEDERLSLTDFIGSNLAGDASPRCFSDLYNKNYNWDFREVDIYCDNKTSGIKSSLRNEKKEVIAVGLDNIIESSEYKNDVNANPQRYETNNKNTDLVSGKLTDYHAPVDVLSTAAQNLFGKTIDGIIVGVGVASILPEDILVAGAAKAAGYISATIGAGAFLAQVSSVGKFISDKVMSNNENAIAKKNSITLEPGQKISSCYLLLRCFWHYKVIYVKANLGNSWVWVPCFASFKTRSENTLDIELTDIDDYKIYEKAGKYGYDFSDNYFNLKPGNRSSDPYTLAKIVFAQFYGSKTIWDFGETTVYAKDASNKVRASVSLDHNTHSIFFKYSATEPIS